MKAKLTGLVVGVVVLALASTAIAVPYASGISKVGDNVSFVLNQNAWSVNVILDGGAQTLDLGTQVAAGQLGFNMAGYSTYEIVIRSYEQAEPWKRYSLDSTDNNFYLPCGVSINKNPWSANFGKVYISESQGGLTVAGRTTTSGIYMLRADAVAAGFATGGKDWGAAGNSSPFKSTIGPDGHLYVADLSNDLAWEFNDDLSSVRQLIFASNKTTGQWVESIYVTGTQAGGNRVIYTVDSNYYSGAPGRKGLIRYDLGGQAAATAGDTGTQVIGPSYFGFYPRDVARDSNGNWYMNQFRSTAGQAPPITKFDGSLPLPINTATWEAPKSYTGAYGIDINENAGIVAYAGYYDGGFYIFDMATGAFVSSFDDGSRLRDVAFDAAGNLVTVDSSGERARFYSPGGAWETVYGSDGTFSVTIVPEPTTLSLVALGGVALLLRRRR